MTISHPVPSKFQRISFHQLYVPGVRHATFGARNFNTLCGLNITNTPYWARGKKIRTCELLSKLLEFSKNQLWELNTRYEVKYRNSKFRDLLLLKIIYVFGGIRVKFNIKRKSKLFTNNIFLLFRKSLNCSEISITGVFMAFFILNKISKLRKYHLNRACRREAC